MRLYTFTHFMLSPMAKGIQATHSTVELYNKYMEHTTYSQLGMLVDWAKNHKTIISLSAGNSPELIDLSIFLSTIQNTYPWASFQEDESLCNLTTSISLVLPEKIYVTAELLRNKIISYNEEYAGFDILVPDREYFEIKEILEGFASFNSYDYELIQKLNTYRMATV